MLPSTPAHLTTMETIMNRHQRRRAKARELKVGDVIDAAIFRISAEDRSAYFWCIIPDPRMPKEEILLTQAWHGPFATEAEAERDQQTVLLGPNCVVTESGVWDPAWDRIQ
jgi:hypothetical protein